jgi:secreted trypsin-like serine protease
MIYYQEKKTCGTNACYGVCGGTLINANYIITAAHCIGTKSAGDITLIAGMHNRMSTTETVTRQFRTVQPIYVHPEYDTVTNMNDIAILRVSAPFTFNQYVQPVCLPGVEPKPNDQVIIVGWGALAFAGVVNDVLKQAYTKIVDKCNSWWPSLDSSKQICVVNAVDGSSACQGDSGGPILAQYNGQYVVSGLTSYVRDCNTKGSTNSPNVYTRVAAYKAWIKSITN